MMRDLPKFINRNWRRASDRFFRLRKGIYQYYKIRKIHGKKTILFILGCQRSGTTLLTEIFERDFDHTKVYSEFSRVSSYDKIDKIRLNPLQLVEAEINKNRASLVVLKPLVESQNALKLLDFFDNAKMLWMYRNYRDVALSNLKHWGIGNGIKNLRAIVEGQPQNWRSENVSAYTREIVIKYFSEEMNPYDAAALFWLVRNRLFFELDLEKHRNVMMCKYEDLVDNPINTMHSIYDFANHIYPFDKIHLKIYSDSKGGGKGIKLSKEIEFLCEEMLGKLDIANGLKQHHNGQNTKSIP
jgi:hypothetical protein